MTINLYKRLSTSRIGDWCSNFNTSKLRNCLLVAMAVIATSVSAQNITTIAGNGRTVNEGDGGLAIGAAVSPFKLHADRRGNVFIGTTAASLRKIDARGFITRFAGIGLQGFSGDGGLATNARLQLVTGIATDTSGNIYISDGPNQRIRKIDTSGIITTIAGDGVEGSSGDGALAVNARLRNPAGLTIDNKGELYVADAGNNRIRKITANGVITTVAGNGVAGTQGDGGQAVNASLANPRSVAVNSAGVIYIVDRDSSRIRQVSVGGVITTIAGETSIVGGGYRGDGGPAINALFRLPESIALDASGNLYIADKNNERIRKIANDGIITTVAGNGQSGFTGDGGLATSASVSEPNDVTVDAVGNVYIADLSNYRVRKVTFSSAPPAIPLSRRGGIDLDGQGRSAIVVQASTGNQLIAGRLVNNIFQWTNLPGPSTDFRVIAPVDFSGSGKSDLPILRETPLNSNGQGSAQYWPSFSGVAPVLLRDVRPAWDVQAVGDLDGDGFGDLVWRFRGQSPNIDDQGVSYIWFTTGTGVAQVRKRGGAPLTWTLLGAADLNGDGAADMVYVSPTNTMRVLMATPNRTCANLNGGSIPAGFTALKLARFASSERSGVLIRNAATGEVRLIFLEATGLTLPPYSGTPDDPNASCTNSTLSVTQTNFNLGTTDPTWTLYATGDFDGNGSYDIVWRRPDNTLTLWLTAEVSGGDLVTIINNAGTAPANATTLPLQ
jgi:sugar lactone lactonase YvrE